MSVDQLPVEFHELLFAIMSPEYLGDILCLYEFEGAVDLPRLRQAVEVAIALEPRWGMKFVERRWYPVWQAEPRAERGQRVHLIPSTNTAATLGELLAQPVETACQIFVIRENGNDLLCFRFDHKLADGSGSRMFVQSIQRHYQSQTPVPATDAPIQSLTFRRLRPLFPVGQRWKLFRQALQQNRRIQQQKKLFDLPQGGVGDEFRLPWTLRYPVGSVEALTRRAMQDRATVTIAMQSAVLLATREIMNIPPGEEMFQQLLVDLRRYLPAEEQKQSSSMLIGMEYLWFDKTAPATAGELARYIRQQLNERRGPTFGLAFCPLAFDVPLLSGWLKWSPYARKRRVLRKGLLSRNLTPKVAVTDLGSYGSPGDRWEPAVLNNAFSSTGYWKVPSFSIGLSQCGTRLNVSISNGPDSVCRKMAFALHRQLTEYVQWSYGEECVVPLGSRAPG